MGGFILNMDMQKKIPFKAGMMFESQENPQFNCMIDFVLFQYDDDNKIIDYVQIIDWSNTNKEEFDKFCNTHCKGKESTFPYAFWGECNVKSFKSRLKKYNLKFIGMNDKETVVYKNDEFEYCEGFKR